MLSFLNPYMLYVKLAGVAAIAVFSIWAFRVNHLRAVHEEQLSKIAASVKAAGYPKNGYDELAGDVDQLAAAADTYKQNWANADAAVATQNQKIQDLGKQTQAAQLVSASSQKLADQASADRDKWIAEARENAKRTVSLPPDQEDKECSDAMDDLFQGGF